MKPATLIDPSGLNTVSFFASASNSVKFFGGDEIPFAWNIAVL